RRLRGALRADPPCLLLLAEEGRCPGRPGLREGRVHGRLRDGRRRPGRPPPLLRVQRAPILRRVLPTLVAPCQGAGSECDLRPIPRPPRPLGCPIAGGRARFALRRATAARRAAATP